MSPEMSKLLSHILEDAGWYPNREIYIDDAVEALNKAGFNSIPNDLLTLFKEFWNLKFENEVDGLFCCLRLNVFDAVDFFNDELCIFIDESGTKQVAFPVGIVDYISILLCCTKELFFYLVSDKRYYLIGNNFVEMMENVLFYREPYLDYELWKIK